MTDLQPARLDGDTFVIAAGAFGAGIHVREIASNWDALSHYPERRARLELEGLAERINAFGRFAAQLEASGGAIVAAEELERFARRHVELTRAFWHAESQCLSSFIVGPANFPLARNAKRQKSRDLRWSEVREHLAAARKAAERRAWPHGAPGGPVRADNPDAPEILREKIAQRRRKQEEMKAVNAAIRAAKTDDPEALAQAVVDATGWSHAVAREVVKPNYMGRRGYESWSLSNNLAEIKRLEQRLAAIEARLERETSSATHETTAGHVELIEDAEAARIRLVFDGKPDGAVRALLKSRGFRWAPSAGAWQRHLNNAGREAARRVLQELAPA